MTLSSRAAIAALLALAAPAAAAPSELAGEDDPIYSCKKGQGPVAVTFKPETELKDLITWAMSFTCKSFLLDPRVVLTGKKVTLIVPTKLTPPEAYQIFLLALSTANATVVPKGPVMRIVDAGVARHDTVPIYRKGLPGDFDQVVRYIYKPSYAQAETLKTAFATLKTDTGDVTAVGSLLILTDFAGNVRDMMSLAKLIDVPTGSDGIYTIPVRHADAGKLAPKLEALLGVNAGAAASSPKAPATATELASAVPSKLMVDERTNTLVVAASEPAYQRVRAIVERLDIALEIEGGATFHVYPLGHAIAEELAATLTQAIAGGQAQTKQPTAGPPPPRPTAPPGPDVGAALEGPVRVIGDKATNSVIVASSGRDFLAIRDIIRQLDLPRRQVYIEAMILEVAVETGKTIGTSGHVGSPNDGGLTFAGVQTPGASTLTTSNLTKSIGAASGALAGVVGPLVNQLGTSIPSYAVLFQAAATAQNSNVLSAPSIIAIDNEEAKYSVGTTYRVSTGKTVSQFGETTNTSPEDASLDLTIKPHISNDDAILLEVKHDAKEIIGETALGPTLSKRSFATRVVVRDQQTVVIGGLMQERYTLDTTKVPLIGDIPILGHLFKYTKRTKRKTNLLVLLTPYIIKDHLDLELLRARKQRQHDEFVGALHSLASMRYEPQINYSRKRGVIEEINRAVLDIETDVAARKALRETPGVAPGPIEYAPKPD